MAGTIISMVVNITLIIFFTVVISSAMYFFRQYKTEHKRAEHLEQELFYYKSLFKRTLELKRAQEEFINTKINKTQE